MTLEMYTVGFGDLIRMGLDLTAMAFDYVLSSPLVAIAIIIGVGAVAIQSLAKGKLEIMQLVLALALFLVMFVPRVDVTVVDLLGDEDSSANGFVVQDVPIGLAIAGSATSAGAAWISGLYQTVFIPDGATGAQFTNQQFAFPLRLMMHLRDIEACDLGVNFCKNLATYTRLCYQPAQASGRFDQEDVYKEPELVFDAERLGMRGAIEYHLDDGETALRSCGDAGEDLEEYLDNVLVEGTMAHGHFSRYLRAKMGDPPGVQGQENSTTVDAGVVRQVATSILGPVSEQRNFTVSHIARQVHNAAESGEFGAGASALWLNQTMERNRLITSVEASSMLRMVLIMMGLMQFLFIVMTPIIAIVALAKMGAGYKLYGSWILLALWSSMFLVTVTVIDFWAQRAVQTRFTDKYVGSAEYSALSVPGLQGAYAAVADILQTAFTFLTAAPLVTLVLLTGSIYPLAAMANRLSGGAEASNLAGTQAVADRGAMQAGQEYVPANNNSYWASGGAPTASQEATAVTQAQALQSRLESTHELRQGAEEATVSSFETASQNQLQSLNQGLHADTNTEEYRDAVEGTRRWITAVTGDSSIAEQMTDKDLQAFTKYWQFGGSAGLGTSGGGPFALGGSFGAGIKGESTETQERLQSVSDKINEQLQGAAQSGSTVQHLNSVAEQWTSQESGSHSEAWSEVEKNADTYKQTTSEIESISDSLATTSQMGSSVALNATTIQGLEGDLHEYGGIPGYLDARANRYGEEVRNQLEAAGGLPDPAAQERGDENLTSVLRLGQMASDDALPAETRYAASDLLNSLFEQMGSGADTAGGADLHGSQIDAPVDRTGVGGEHLEPGALGATVQSQIGSARGEVDEGRQNAPDLDATKERAWSGILGERLNEARMEETREMDQRLEGEQEHLSRYASGLVPDGMNRMAYQSFSSIDEALERARELDGDPNLGSGHEDFVHAMGFYFMDPETQQVDMASFNQDLRNLSGPDKENALDSQAVKWMVSLSESADEQSKVAWMWANDHLDSETLAAAPDDVRSYVNELDSQAGASQLVSEWKNLVQGGYAGDGSAGALISDGQASQTDMAKFAYERLADPRFTEPMHAGVVHNAIAQHGDFSEQEIEKIAALEASGDQEGATRALMESLKIEPTKGPFGDHVRVEGELHPRVIQQEAIEAGATEAEYNRNSPLLGRM